MSSTPSKPVMLRVRVTPRASSNAVIGLLGELRDELSVKVTAVAEGGKANAAVVKLLARELKIPKSAVRIQRGETARHKLIALDIDQNLFDAWLEQL